MTPRPESIELTIDGHQYTAIRHRDPDQPAALRMLCLHGWLDNANSFLPLMPFLPSIDLVAVDLPGHGHSAHPATGYLLPEMAWWTLSVIKALDWPSCHLTGHSLGAGIAPMVAVASPDSIESLILIEAVGSLSEKPELLPQRLRRAMQQRADAGRYQSRRFAEKSQAVEARLQSAQMAKPSAQLIVDRQLQQDPDGYRWRFDPRLRLTSPQYQTEEQVCSILAAVACPTLTIMGDDGYPFGRDDTAGRVACLQQHSNRTLTGHHHLHMDTPEPVAAAINEFLGTRPALGG